jgi:hypothetical protein
VELTADGPAITVGATSGVVGEMAAAVRSVPLMTGMFEAAAAGELAGAAVTALAVAGPAVAAVSVGRPTTFAGCAFFCPTMLIERFEGATAVAAVAAVAVLVPGVPTTFALSV